VNLCCLIDVKPAKVGFFIGFFMYYQGVKKTIVVRTVEKKGTQLGNIHPLLERTIFSQGYYFRGRTGSDAIKTTLAVVIIGDGRNGCPFDHCHQ
jgi:hypothetical protein